MTYAYQATDVRNAARGHWGTVLSALAPQLRDAMARPGRHVSCPVHGGTNGFRMYRDFEENGASVCNTCGNFRDGFQTLMFVNDWNFSTAVNEVGRVLGLKRTAYETIDAQTEVGITYCGTLTSIIYESVAGRRVYTVRLKDEATGSVVRCIGNDLERAIEAAGIVKGDRIRLEHLRTVTAHSEKHAYKRHVWAALKLPSKEEERLLEEKKIQTDQTKAKAIESLWQTALALNAPQPGKKLNAAEMYLWRRGIRDAELLAGLNDNLRYVPALEYNHADGRVSRHPALVAAVRSPDGTLVSVHRTYLSETGFKAEVEVAKKMMSLPEGQSLNGCAIRLGSVKGLIGVAEGIETALSVRAATGLTCWSTVSAYGMSVFEPPEGVKIVLIWADKDRSETGAKAAKALMRRLAEKGILGIIMSIDQEIPANAKGIDWNDVLVRYGKDAFPAMSPTCVASTEKKAE